MLYGSARRGEQEMPSAEKGAASTLSGAGRGVVAVLPEEDISRVTRFFSFLLRLPCVEWRIPPQQTS